MKTLVIVRHAKSSREDASLPDFKRPLSKRGEHDAPIMGQLLRRKVAAPDLILTSPAIRALSTAKLIAEELPCPEERIVPLPGLYNGDAREIQEIVEGTDPAIKILLLVGHNPGMTEFANRIADCGIDNIPTCGIVALAFDLKSWADIRPKSGKLLFFEYPKKEK